MIKETKEIIGWNVDSGHRFFCVDQFQETDFRKVSSGGIQGPRLKDITSYLKEETTDKELAKELWGKDWN